MPEYPVWEIERKAADVLRQAYPQSMPDSFIDNEWVIEAHVGIEILPVPGLRNGWEIDVLLRRYIAGGYDIIVDQDLADNLPHRYRFTLGEELGHLVLQAEHLPKANSIEEAISLYRRFNESFVLHRNARRFAAAILMPIHTLVTNTQRVYGELVSRVGTGDPEAIRKYVVSRLAQMYEVSAETMRIRLREHPHRLNERIEKALKEGLDCLP